MSSSILTKTDYLAYGQCPKQLWLIKHRPGLAAPPDSQARRRLFAGQEVDRLARRQFAEGHSIPYQPDPCDMVSLTEQAIENGEETLYQATVAADNLLVKVDILAHVEGGWHLIEVKSSTRFKAEEHLADVAFQVYVLRQAGMEVVQASVMHLNSTCYFPHLANLFTLTDVTADVELFLDQVAADVHVMTSLAAERDAPDWAIGRHCRKPRCCPFHGHCWQEISGRTIYDIPNLKRPIEAALEAAAVLYVADVPRGYALGHKRAATYVETANEQIVDIDVTAIQARIQALDYPLYFLDFETIDYAVPVFDGCRPYQQVPFQFSCHILAVDGRLEHVDYLHCSADDPRPALVDALLSNIGNHGHLVAYNAHFEKDVLRQLARQYPDQARRLDDMADRLWDQLDVFRRHYSHYAFGGSNSLKAVLPVVVPGLSYDPLAVRDGKQAQIVWEEMISCEDESRKAELIDQLRAYCRLDTLAMVEIHMALGAL